MSVVTNEWLPGYTIPAEQLTRPDPSSFSNHHVAQITEIHVEMTPDLEAQTIATTCDIKVVINQDNAVVLSIDTLGLDFDSVELISDLKGVPANTKVIYANNVESDKNDQGNRCVIGLPQAKPTVKGDVVCYRFIYTIKAGANAAQFCTKEQTASGLYPLMYTQCQSTYARSLLPIQDACAAKIKYTTQITVPQPLLAIMSAYDDGEPIVDDEKKTITYKYKQPHPIPPYLYAVLIGEFIMHKFPGRTAVVAQPSQMETAKIEYANLDATLSAVEEIAGPYRWGNYTIASMPASFPFGGMEGNPLTYNSGTLLPLAREKLVGGQNCMICETRKAMGLAEQVGCHEIAHSWSGNLVTNQDWSEFMLNEGLTQFLTLRATRKIYGTAEEGLHLLINWEALRDSVEFFAAAGNTNAQKLVPDLEIDSAENIFSSIPYHKGELFFYHLEDVMGGEERFEAFLKVYFNTFEFKTINHNQLKDFYINYCTEKGFADRLSEIDWDEWFFTPGMPKYRAKIDMSLATPVQDAAHALFATPADLAAAIEAKTVADVSQYKVAEFTMTQQNVFFDKVLELFDAQYEKAQNKPQYQQYIREVVLPEIKKHLDLAQSLNCELLSRFLYLHIRANIPKDFVLVTEKDGKAVTMAETIDWFLSLVGRLKFVRPFYRLMLSSPLYNEFAAEIFEKHQPSYHPISTNMLKKDFAEAKTKGEAYFKY